MHLKSHYHSSYRDKEDMLKSSDCCARISAKRRQGKFSAFVRLICLLLIFTLSDHVRLRGAGVDGFRFCKHNESDIKLVNNRYEKITVWIGPEVPAYNFTLLTHLQDLFTKASTTLYDITGNRAYFGEIQVILPHTWGVLPEPFLKQLANSSVPLHGQAQALIRVRNSYPRFSQETNSSWKLGDRYAYVNKPYVIKTTPCGFAGSHMRIAPEFIRFGEEAREQLGAPEKAIAAEWAKLRWGVYTENPTVTAETGFYLRSDLEVRPIACSAVIPGSLIDKEAPEKSCTSEESLYSQRCRFEPSAQDQPLPYASLMYRSNLSYVNRFCDDADNVAPELSHDEEAPTVHNLHCKGRSVWSVMRDHPDFANGSNPPANVQKTAAGLQVEPPSPTFTFVQQLDRRIVVVLDVSTSMTLFGRMQLMMQAASHYIDTVPINTWIGIVCFAAKAQTKARLTEIRNDDARQLLKKRLAVMRTVPGTSIANGIEEGLSVLSTSGPTALRGSGGSIIVLTDGLEHNQPKINETVLEKVKEFGTRVSTIAFGSKVSKDLEWLASVSGGHTHAASSGEFGIDSELLEAFLSHHEVADVGAVPIVSKEVSVRSNSTLAESFIIDESVGKNTRISAFYTLETVPVISLQSPDGINYTAEDASHEDVLFTLDSDFQSISITIMRRQQVGEWTVYVRNNMLTTRLPVRLNVISYPTDEEPLVISPALLCRSLDFTGAETLVIYAYISKGELAVLDANVVAEITRPLSASGIVDTRRIVLQDSGTDPDVTRNDGVYSAYFINFTAKGRYNVKVYVDDNNQRASIDYEFLLGIGRLQEQPAVYDTRHLVPGLNLASGQRERSRARRSLGRLTLPAFQRVSSAAGAFSVKQWTVDDTCKPGYTHFQDSCYKVIRSPQLHFDSAQSYCEADGGKLSELNSRQELSWLATRITPATDSYAGNAWFGGVDEALRSSDDFDFEQIASRVRRGMRDDDLETLTSLFGQDSLTSDLIYAADSFDPDLHGMTARDVNKLIHKLGVRSRRALIVRLRDYATNLRKKTRDKINLNNVRSRKRRQLSPGGLDFAGLLVLAGGEVQSIDTTQPQTTTLAMTSQSNSTQETSSGDLPESTSTFTNSLPLSPAKSEPKVPDPLGSGADIPTCSWFQKGKIIESTGDICLTRRKFVCELPVRDRFPPSRITDLRGAVDTTSKLLSLSWSAPGDDLDIGRADGYDIRTLRTRKARHVLSFDFEQGDKIASDAIVTGNIRRPREAGNMERLVVNLTASNECPPHAAIDLFLALPSKVFDIQKKDEPLIKGDSELKNTLIQFIKEVLEKFKISPFEVQVAVITHTIIAPVFHFKEHKNSSELFEKLATVAVEVKLNSTIEDIVRKYDMKSGRLDAAKVLLIVTDNDVKRFANISGVTTLIVASDPSVDKKSLWASATAPGCNNSFAVDDVNKLGDVAKNVGRQLCEARITEYQAVGVAAFDDVGQRGTPSNIYPFVMRFDRQPVACPQIESPPVALVSANLAQTIGVAVAVPAAIILSIVGAVMLFGQAKKWKKKRQEKKEKMLQQQNLERARAAVATSSQQDWANENNNNDGALRTNVFKNRVAPVQNPPV